jgi:adenine deaminase
MTVETFIRAMPKVELNVQLVGGWKKDTLLMLVEENDIRAHVKHFDNWLKQLDKPDYSRLDDLIRMVATWFVHAEDLTRLVYDLGVHLHKQNVVYAEVFVNPQLFAHMGLSNEAMLEALNDGRDRVLRGWGVKLAWVLAVPRDEPRRADEVLRLASTVAGRKAGIVGIGFPPVKDSGAPIAPMERIFKGAEKKELARIPYVAENTTPEMLLEMLRLLNPTRLNEGGHQLLDALDARGLVIERNLTVMLSAARTLCNSKTATYADYPVRRLLEMGVRVALSADMPSYFKSALSDEYLAMAEHNGLTLEQIQRVALNAVEASLLTADAKTELLASMRADFSLLRENLSL